MKGPWILIIDDDPFFRGTLKWLLEANGFSVEVATDTDDAYPVIARGQLDLIIIDLMLPDSDGFELIRWVREHAEFTDIPIMAVSGHNRNYLVAALSAGANEALHKPDDLDRIVEVATKLTEQPRHCDDHPAPYRRAS